MPWDMILRAQSGAHRPGGIQYNACMLLEAGMIYRARTAAGHKLTFTVLDPGEDGVWAVVDLQSPEGAEPNVWLNTDQLLWISVEARRAPISKAAAEVIEALEKTAEEPE